MQAGATEPASAPLRLALRRRTRDAGGHERTDAWLRGLPKAQRCVRVDPHHRSPRSIALIGARARVRACVRTCARRRAAGMLSLALVLRSGRRGSIDPRVLAGSIRPKVKSIDRVGGGGKNSTTQRRMDWLAPSSDVAEMSITQRSLAVL